MSTTVGKSPSQPRFQLLPYKPEIPLDPLDSWIPLGSVLRFSDRGEELGYNEPLFLPALPASATGPWLGLRAFPDWQVSSSQSLASA
jgi:hypothetical protein